jgi:hypothetical protein
MKRNVLLRIYPRAWRQRYGEELSEQLEQRALSLGVVLICSVAQSMPTCTHCVAITT